MSDKNLSSKTRVHLRKRLAQQQCGVFAAKKSKPLDSGVSCEVNVHSIIKTNSEVCPVTAGGVEDQQQNTDDHCHNRK